MKEVALALAHFCDRNIRDFVPQNPRMRERYDGFGKVHLRCVQALLAREADIRPDRMFTRDFERRLAWRYFDAYTNRRSRGMSVEKIAAMLEEDARTFLQLATCVLSHDEGRDLLKLERCADLLRHYSEPEKAYALLLAVAQQLPDDCREALQNAPGYKLIVQWGATQFLRDFWLSLQREYGITHTAIKGQAAQNLAQSLGEAETYSRQQKESYEERIADLEERLALAYEKSAVDLARRLQDRPSPLLPQIEALYALLQQKFFAQENLPSELMSTLIVLEDLLQALQEIGISRYPNEEHLTITRQELREYSYAKGSPFTGDSEQKRVRCIRPGWKACGQVISAAVVEEETEPVIVQPQPPVEGEKQ